MQAEITIYHYFIEAEMSIAYEINKDMGATCVVWDRTVNAEQFLAQANRLSSDANWPPLERRHITDLRSAFLDASMNDATLEQVADIYGCQPGRLANMKIAIVAHHGFERASAFERMLMRYGPRVVVFNQVNTACTWLGMPFERVETRLHQLRAAARAGAN
jgi:hypothetical protein